MREVLGFIILYIFTTITYDKCTLSRAVSSMVVATATTYPVYSRLRITAARIERRASVTEGERERQ